MTEVYVIEQAAYPKMLESKNEGEGGGGRKRGRGESAENNMWAIFADHPFLESEFESNDEESKT